MRLAVASAAIAFAATIAPGLTITPGPDDLRHNLQIATDNLRLEIAPARRPSADEGFPGCRPRLVYKPCLHDGKPTSVDRVITVLLRCRELNGP